MCNNYNYDLSKLVVGRYYPVEGKVCRLMSTKKFDGYTKYHFSDWRLGGGRVYTIYENADAEVERFEALGDWSKDSVLNNNNRLCHGKIVETLSQCEITDNTIIAEYHNNKSRQDKDVAEFYEARPHLNHD
jgi:hypothetical protein